MLPFKEYDKIGSNPHELGIGLHDSIPRSDNLLVIDFSVKSYRTLCGLITAEEAKELRGQYLTQLEPNLNKVYDNGSGIWIK
jgi:hypothetical protein